MTANRGGGVGGKNENELCESERISAFHCL